MRILHLYRPTLPGLRAQAIQVLHTCQALAARGHTVTLLADRGRGSRDPDDVLGDFGLPPTPGLDLHLQRWRQRGLAGWGFRRELASWWSGPPGLVLARDKGRLAKALDQHGKSGHRIVLETHELDSALAAERGKDPAALAALEARLAGQSDALVANCGGTLAAWRDAHALPEVHAVVHNGTAPNRARAQVADPEPVVRSVGSPKGYKGVETLLAAAPDLPLPVELIGGNTADRKALSGRKARLLGPVPYPAVPWLLAYSSVLVLPLADNLFGRQLTSPLKLWDYLATTVPIVAPDLPSVAEIATISGVPLHLHRPGDPADLVRAVREALDAPPRPAFLRTWDDRAAALDEIFEQVCDAPVSP